MNSTKSSSLTISLVFHFRALIKAIKWQELGHQVSLVRNVAEKVFSEMGASLSYKVGTMIEIPRAALVADEVC